MPSARRIRPKHAPLFSACPSGRNNNVFACRTEQRGLPTWLECHCQYSIGISSKRMSIACGFAPDMPWDQFRSAQKSAPARRVYARGASDAEFIFATRMNLWNETNDVYAPCGRPRRCGVRKTARRTGRDHARYILRRGGIALSFDLPSILANVSL